MLAVSSGDSALLQLEDSLKALPEIYKVLLTLGGNETKERVRRISQALNDARNSGYFDLTFFDSLFSCHECGFEFLTKYGDDICDDRNSELRQSIEDNAVLSLILHSQFLMFVRSHLLWVLCLN